MSYSEVSICNTALVRCGSDPNIIASLTEGSAEAKACNAVYALKRDLLQGIGRWGMGNAYQTLTLTGSTAPLGWSFEYQYPNDCRSLLGIVNPAGREAPVIPYMRGVNAAGASVIWTNMEFAVAEMSRLITNPTRFSAEFADALAWFIATDVSIPLTHSEKIIGICQNGFKSAIQNALALNALEQEIGTEGPPVDWLEAR